MRVHDRGYRRAGDGEVSTQWLTRNSGADAGPRLGRQLSAACEASVSWAAFLNLNGVSCNALRYARGYQEMSPPSFSAITTSRCPESIISRSVGNDPNGPRYTRSRRPAWLNARSMS